jgi:DNA-binding transcriptional regulator YiaG
MGFGTDPRQMKHRKSESEKLAVRLRAWREKNDLSQSEAALRLQISKRTLQEWEQERAEPRGLASAAIGKAIRA